MHSRVNLCKFIGTLNKPQDHYKDFMAQDWLAELHKRSGAVYTVGQLEKGEEGTVHLQYFVNVPKPGKRITAMKKVCKHTHWEPVQKDNGAADYCMKEETRIEGPWTFGEKPLNMTVSEDNLKRRKLKNEEIIKGNLKDLIDKDEISISQLPLLTKALE